DVCCHGRAVADRMSRDDLARHHDGDRIHRRADRADASGDSIQGALFRQARHDASAHHVRGAVAHAGLGDAVPLDRWHRVALLDRRLHLCVVEGTRDVSASSVRAVFLASLLSVARLVGAQVPSPPRYAEFRLDAIMSDATSAYAGAGAVIPLGTYVRFGIDAAGGATFHDGTSRASGRVDAIAR